MYPIIDKIKTGEKIRMLMEANGYSVNDIQEYLGLACVQSIYHWLNGSCLPSIDNLYALSDLLNVSIDDMICGNKLEKINQNIPDRVLHYYDILKDIIAAQAICICSNVDKWREKKASEAANAKYNEMKSSAL